MEKSYLDSELAEIEIELEEVIRGSLCFSLDWKLSPIAMGSMLAPTAKNLMFISQLTKHSLEEVIKLNEDNRKSA